MALASLLEVFSCSLGKKTKASKSQAAVFIQQGFGNALDTRGECA